MILARRAPKLRPNCRPRRRALRGGGGFTLLEMLTTVAALIVLLGLTVSLARQVRNASAQELTKDLLRRLDNLMDLYEQHHDQMPAVTPLIAAQNVEPDEAALQRAAMENNKSVLAALRGEAGLTSDTFAGLPDALYDDATLRDAWGTPIAYMSGMHQAIGMAPKNRPFFFSAGPDRRFLTQEDNLYSYEDSAAASIRRDRKTVHHGDTESTEKTMSR